MDLADVSRWRFVLWPVLSKSSTDSSAGWTEEPDLVLQGNAQNQQRIQEEYDVAYDKYLAGFTAWQRKQLKAANSIRSVCEDRAKAFIKDIDFVDDALIALEKEFKPKGDASL